jgi:osmotically-inducible protein OsmY
VDLHQHNRICLYSLDGVFNTMGWIKKMFGMEKPAGANVQAQAAPDAVDPETGGAVAPERVGLNGEYDQSGLAKRVALAFDEDAAIADIDTLWVAQTGGAVVLKGTAPSQDVLDQMVALASGVSGATEVNTDGVTIG